MAQSPEYSPIPPSEEGMVEMRYQNPSLFHLSTHVHWIITLFVMAFMFVLGFSLGYWKSTPPGLITFGSVPALLHYTVEVYLIKEQNQLANCATTCTLTEPFPRDRIRTAILRGTHFFQRNLGLFGILRLHRMLPGLLYFMNFTVW
jgi:hypothetical protein